MNTIDQACYLGNGNQIPDGTVSHVCDTTGTINTCCPLNNVCLSNGLCYGEQAPSSYFNFTRFACTDPDNSKCLPNCASSQYNGGNGDAVCGNQFTGYCCFEDHANGLCNCDTGENAFTLPYGTPISTIATIAPSVASQLAASMSTISSLSNCGITEGIIPATASGSSSTAFSTSLQSSTFSSAGTSSIISSTLPTVGSTQAPGGSERLSTGADVGIAVGVALAVVIAGIGGWAIIRRRLSKKPTPAEMPAKGNEVLESRGVPARSELPAKNRGAELWAID